jgi:translation initiation factor 2B subunit (eIF-2B alpha/beta/delta family)
MRTARATKKEVMARNGTPGRFPGTGQLAVCAARAPVPFVAAGVRVRVRVV